MFEKMAHALRLFFTIFNRNPYQYDAHCWTFITKNQLTEITIFRYNDLLL